VLQGFWVVAPVLARVAQPAVRPALSELPAQPPVLALLAQPPVSALPVRAACLAYQHQAPREQCS
jgi:hypothetical protein